MDETEFDEFYTASFARLVGQLHAMIGNRDEAQDCVQEAFARAWVAPRKLNRTEHPEAWVRTTAYRLAVSRWRRTVVRRRPADRALQPQRPVARPRPRPGRPAGRVARLPLDQRRALVLHHLCDLRVAAVAAETGAPEGTVKARLSRGRAALAALLDDPRTRGGSPPWLTCSTP